MTEGDTTPDNFSKGIHYFTLKFTEPQLEVKYNKVRDNSPRSFWHFNICSVILIVLLVWRRLENFFISNSSHRSVSLSISVTITNLSCTAAALLLELAIHLTRRFAALQGFFYLVYTFFTVSYTSKQNEKLVFEDIPLGIPSYISAFALGSIYIRCWMAGASACFLGFAIKLYFIWIQKGFNYESIIFSIIYAASYLLLAIYFYLNEYGVKYRFYLLHKQEELQNNYHELIKNMPVGLVLLDLNNKPFFYNHAIEEIASREDNRLATEAVEEPVAKRIGRILAQFRDKGTQADLRTAVEHWNASGMSRPRPYTYLEDSMYVVRGLEGTFRQAKCRVLILEDQTSLYNLNKVEKKYQKLYLASVVHDIRTPLNGIFGMLEMIDMQKLEKESQAYIDTAKNMCKLMLFLTYDIIDYTQLEASRFKLNYARVNIRSVIEEVHQLMEANIKKKALQYELRVDESVPEAVWIDKTRYMQVLLNLAVNAIKYTFQGYVRVALTYNEENDLIITSIKDTGIGIKREDFPKLFKLYGKIDANIEYNVTGVGFGLSISKKLAECMQGYITVESKEKEGSVFTFAIRGNKEETDLAECRVEQSAASENAGASIREDVALPAIKCGRWSNKPKSFLDPRFDQSPNCLGIKNKQDIRNITTKSTMQNSCPNFLSEELKCDCAKLLIVDDNECNLFVLQNYLKSFNVVADEALNGQQAVDKIVSKAAAKCCSRYKLVLMDINMPIMDGIKATKIIREKAERGEVPRTAVVALSAKSLDDEDHTAFCHRIGFTDYLNKPILKRDFTNLITSYGVV